MDNSQSSSGLQFIEFFACIGLSSTLLPGVLWASLDLTELYLDRLKKFNPVLECAVTIMFAYFSETGPPSAPESSNDCRGFPSARSSKICRCLALPRNALA